MSLLMCCSTVPDPGPVIGSLEHSTPSTEDDLSITTSRQEAIESYRRFLEISNRGPVVAQAMRRLADLKIAQSDEKLISNDSHDGGDSVDEQYQRTYADSIELYKKIIRDYPEYVLNDRVLYRLARAYEHTGQTSKALASLDRLVDRFPNSSYLAEAQFRRGELFFVAKSFRQAGHAYQAVTQLSDDTPYDDHALYKKGWSHFKQQDFPAALDAFMALVQRTLSAAAAQLDLANLPRVDRELLDDSLRAISLCFSYQSGEASVAEYLKAHGPASFEDLVYGRLGDMYLEKERFSDAAKTYGAFVKRSPIHHRAPLFQMKVIEAQRRGNFPNEILAAKKDFVNRFRLDSDYWRHHEPAQRQGVVDDLKLNLSDLARHYHGQAQQTKNDTPYREAISRYRMYIESFPKASETPGMNFLLAEILFEMKQYQQAALEYERTAYHYKPHDKAPEAGYAALLAYDRMRKVSKFSGNTAIKRKSINSGLRFVDQFPRHSKAAHVLTQASEDLYLFDKFDTAIAVAQRVIRHYPSADLKLRRTAWIVLAHCAFETNDYVQAESAYQNALELQGKGDENRTLLEQRLAAAIYKQGEISRQAGNLTLAIDHFLRLGKVLPNANIRSTAQYDAAAALIELQRWESAARMLEAFRKQYPRHELQSEVTQKLAVAYQQSGQLLNAASEYARMGGTDGDPSIRQEALWQAAELYSKAGAHHRSVKMFKEYISNYPKPFEPAVEARYRLVALYEQQNNARKARYWRNEIIKSDAKAGSRRTDRTRYLAATAALELARVAHGTYRGVKLAVPLKKSLKKKKMKMEKALQAFAKAADYGVQTVTTASTFYIASIYHDFGRALLDSERPSGLSSEELEQYNILLEEQAYPFEEKAIEIYEVNARRTAEGVYDPWIKKSMAELAELLPVRYAKSEQSVQLVEAIH